MNNNNEQELSFTFPQIVSLLSQLILKYALPLGAGLIGIFFVGAGIIAYSRLSDTSSEVVFNSEATASAGTVTVDVAGAVMKAGVYSLPSGSRIADALIQAGGLSASADREWLGKYLNRAAILTDGGKIFIPEVGENENKIQNSEFRIQNEQGSNLLGVTEGKVNINTASQAELEELPGVGPKTAEKIISGRPYQAVEELLSKKILGNALYGKLKDLLTAP